MPSPQDLKAALDRTDAWLDRVHARWLAHQWEGLPLGVDTDPHGAAGEIQALEVSDFRALWEGLGYGPGHRLPPEVARHRSPSGSTVIDELLIVRFRSAHIQEWGEVLSWALEVGWSPWAPGYEGSSAVVWLLEQTSRESTWDLFERLDRAGVKWDTPMQDPADPLSGAEALVLGNQRIIPGGPGETLLMQAVSHCSWEEGDDFLAPVIERWIETLPNPAPSTQEGRSLDDLTSVRVGQLKVAGWVNRRLGRERASARATRAELPTQDHEGRTQRRRRFRS